MDIVPLIIIVKEQVQEDMELLKTVLAFALCHIYGKNKFIKEIRDPRVIVGIMAVVMEAVVIEVRVVGIVKIAIVSWVILVVVNSVILVLEIIVVLVLLLFLNIVALDTAVVHVVAINLCPRYLYIQTISHSK